MLVINAGNRRPGAERRVTAWLEAFPGVGLVVPGVHIPGRRRSRRSGSEVDLLVFTPHVCVVMAVESIRFRVAGILSCPADGPWTLPGVTGDPILLRRKGDSNPLQPTTDSRDDLRGMLEQKFARAGSGLPVDVVVMVVPQYGYPVELVTTSRPVGGEVLLGNNSGALYDWLRANSHGEWTPWTAERVLVVLTALEITEITRADLIAVGFPAAEAGRTAPAQWQPPRPPVVWAPVVPPPRSATPVADAAGESAATGPIAEIPVGAPADAPTSNEPAAVAPTGNSPGDRDFADRSPVAPVANDAIVDADPASEPPGDRIGSEPEDSIGGHLGNADEPAGEPVSSRSPAQPAAPAEPVVSAPVAQPPAAAEPKADVPAAQSPVMAEPAQRAVPAEPTVHTPAAQPAAVAEPAARTPRAQPRPVVDVPGTQEVPVVQPEADANVAPGLPVSDTGFAERSAGAARDADAPAPDGTVAAGRPGIPGARVVVPGAIPAPRRLPGVPRRPMPSRKSRDIGAMLRAAAAFAVLIAGVWTLVSTHHAQAHSGTANVPVVATSIVPVFPVAQLPGGSPVAPPVEVPAREMSVFDPPIKPCYPMQPDC